VRFILKLTTFKYLEIFVINLVLSFSSFADPTLYFRWGPYDTNKIILEKGGFPGNAAVYDQDLYSGESATYTEDLYKKLAEWNSMNQDAASTGLYNSSDLFDSMSFGKSEPSLLIIEVDVSDGKKTMYSYTKTWNVATKNNIGPHIKIRPPSPNDVKKVWTQLTQNIQNESLHETIFSLCSSLQRHYGRHLFPNSTKIFLERIIFDESLDYLAKEIDRISRTVATAKDQRFLKSVLALFITKSPDHQIVQKLLPLTSIWGWEDSTVRKLILNENPQMLIEMNRHATPAMREQILQLFEGPDFFSANMSRDNRLNVLLHYANTLSPNRTTNIRTELEKRLSHGTPYDLSNNFLETIDKFLGPDISQQHKKNIIHASFENYLDINSNLLKNIASTDHQNGVLMIKEIIIKELENPSQEFSELISGVTKSTSQRSFHAGSFSKWWELYFRLQNNSLSNTLSHAQKSELEAARKVLKEVLPKNLEAWNMEHIPNQAAFFQVLLDTNPSPDIFVKTIEQFSADFPNFNNQLIAGLKNFRLTPQFQKSPLQLKVFDALEKLEKSTKTGLAKISKGHAATPPINNEQRQRISLVKWESAFENIPNSQEYSQLSRTFVLVDPLLVSEDLRKMEATKPWLRFNENYIEDGVNYKQLAWENFINAWETEAPGLLVGKDANLYRAGLSLVTGKVEGGLNAGSGEIDLEYRNSLAPTFTIEEWKAAGGLEVESHLGKFFEINKTENLVTLKFKRLPAPGHSWLQGGTASTTALSLIMDKVGKIKNPIDRAAKILDEVPKVHALNNGNGRLARFWAAAELTAAGFPMPLGFSTNDFFMNPERMKLEVRKAVALGKFWEEMLKNAEKDGVKVEDFFQKVFKGSSLEGLLLITPHTDLEMKQLVEYLESLDTPPAWAADFMREVETQINAINRSGKSIGTISELDQHNILNNLWKNFLATSKKQGRCASHLKQLIIEYSRN